MREMKPSGSHETHEGNSGARRKPYPEAGHALSQLLDQFASGTLEQQAKRLNLPLETLRSYRNGWSAPRQNAEIWTVLKDTIGEIPSDQYRSLLEVARESSPGTSTESLITNLFERGRLGEARRELISAGPEAIRNAALWFDVGRAFLDRGSDRFGRELYAIGIASLRARRSTDLARRVSELAAHLTQQELYGEARDVCVAEIVITPTAGELWRRLGVVQWYSNDLPAAYGSLTAALSHGVSKSRVFHARGQVLAEMGHFPEAVEDLTVAMANPLSSYGAAYARSTRAYAYFMLGDAETGLREFGSAEDVTPTNAWLHWFRGRCFESVGEEADALASFERSVACSDPSLNRAKRVYAEDFIESYNGLR